MADGAISVKGLRELNRAFAAADKQMKNDLRKRLRVAAKPVADEAEGLALSRIRNMDSHWSRMRIGTTQQSVYMVPFSRRRMGKGYGRANLAPLLLERAMEPALDNRADELRDAVNDMLGDIEQRWGN